MPDADNFHKNGNAASSSISRRTIAKPPSVRPPRPQKRRRRQAPARGPAAVCSLHRPNRNETKRPSPLLVGLGRVYLEPKALAGGTAAPPARGAGVLFSMRHPGARGKEGAVPCDAALPRWGKGRCRCARSTLFAPAGQKRFRVARLILGVSRERAVCGAVCPSGMAGRRAGKTEACRPMLHEAATFLPPSRGENGGLCPHPLKGSIP